MWNPVAALYLLLSACRFKRQTGIKNGRNPLFSMVSAVLNILFFEDDGDAEKFQLFGVFERVLCVTRESRH